MKRQHLMCRHLTAEQPHAPSATMSPESRYQLSRLALPPSATRHAASGVLRRKVTGSGLDSVEQTVVQGNVQGGADRLERLRKVPLARSNVKIASGPGAE